jgi:hypothetical protein
VLLEPPAGLFAVDSLFSLHDAPPQYVAIRSQRFHWDAPYGGSVINKRVHISLAEILLGSEYDEMGCVRDLGLPVGGCVSGIGTDSHSRQRSLQATPARAN